MAKKLVRALADYSSHEVFSAYGGPVLLVDFIAKLQVIHDELTTSGWKDPNINIEVVYDGYDSADLNVEITGQRLETDKEETRRLVAEERAAAQKKKIAEAKAKSLKQKEADEIAELARLKAKYEL